MAIIFREYQNVITKKANGELELLHFVRNWILLVWVCCSVYFLSIIFSFDVILYGKRDFDFAY